MADLGFAVKRSAGALVAVAVLGLVAGCGAAGEQSFGVAGERPPDVAGDALDFQAESIGSLSRDADEPWAVIIHDDAELASDWWTRPGTAEVDDGATLADPLPAIPEGGTAIGFFAGALSVGRQFQVTGVFADGEVWTVCVRKYVTDPKAQGSDVMHYGLGLVITNHPAPESVRIRVEDQTRDPQPPKVTWG
jgi:hypothetical protein